MTRRKALLLGILGLVLLIVGGAMYTLARDWFPPLSIPLGVAQFFLGAAPVIAGVILLGVSVTGLVDGRRKQQRPFEGLPPWNFDDEEEEEEEE